MAENNSIYVQLGVKYGDLFTGLAKAQEAIKSSTESMKTSLEGLMGGVSSIGKAFGVLAAIASGGAMFAKAIDGVKQVSGEAKMMGKVLGITTTEASIFNVALQSIGGSTDQAKTAILMMTRTLGTSPEKFDKLGVATKDANGNLRPMSDILLDVNDKFGKMTDGTAKNLAMAEIFGRKWMDIGPVMGMTSAKLEEARIHAESLNLVVGAENERDTKLFKGSMAGMSEVLAGIQKTIGQAVMPLLTDMGRWFASLGPAAILITQGAIGLLVSALQGLKIIILAVLEVAKTLVQALTIGLVMAADMVIKALHGDWEGVNGAWENGTGQMADSAKENFKSVTTEAEKTWSDVKQLFSGQTATKHKEGTDAPDLGKGGKGGKDASESLKAQAAVIKAELEGQLLIQKEYLAEAQEYYSDAYKHNLITTEEFYADKLAIERQGIKGAIGIKEEELRQIKELETRAKATGKQSDVLGLKAQELKLTAELTVLNAQAGNSEVKNTRELTEALQQKKIAMQEIARVSQQQVGSAQIDRERILFEQAKALHQISDADAIQAEMALQDRLYQIDLQALRDKEMQLDGNLEKIAANNAAIEQLERTHQTKIAQIKSQGSIEANKDLTAMNAGIRGSFENSIAGMLQGALTLKKGLQAVWTGILQGFTQMIGKKVVAWAMGETTQTAATVAGDSTRTASGWMAATQSVLATSWAVVKNIAMKAWEAAASVYASIAAIPVFGPALAPVMAIAATGAVMGFASHIASARGGYDIPAGLNPVTQLHEREMVLPQAQADVIRNMAGGGGGGGDVHLHVSAMDGQSVARLFRDNGEHIVSSLKNQRRNLAF